MAIIVFSICLACSLGLFVYSLIGMDTIKDVFRSLMFAMFTLGSLIYLFTSITEML